MATPLIDGRYLPLGSLGRGGMASVLRAFDRVRERTVALKVPSESRPAGAPDHPLAAEFVAWAPIRHPNVVRVLEYAIQNEGPLEPNLPYLVLEHVAGLPLHRALAAGQVSAVEQERVGVLALRALDRVHGAGLVHRDLKPGNLLVRRPRGRPLELKLTDFGLAAPIGTREPPGTISGSLPYVAPETILGRALDGRSDLYSLGIALFHLATGRLPCQAAQPEQLLRWHLTGAPADPRLLRPTLPERWSHLIRTLTERNPGSRPASAREALALVGAEPDEPSPAPPLPIELRGLRLRLRLALDAARLGADRVIRFPDDASLDLPVRQWIARARTLGARVLELAPDPHGDCPLRIAGRELVIGESLDRGVSAPDPELGAVDALGRFPAADNPRSARDRLIARLLRDRPPQARVVIAWERSRTIATFAAHLQAELNRRTDGSGGLLLIRLSRSATGPGT